MFVVEGNIGSGKSTLLQRLEEKHGIHVVQEPVSLWMDYKDADNISVFQKFYKNPERYGFAFQMFVTLTRLRRSQEVGNRHSLFERSVLTDKHVFMKALHERATISNIEHKIFEDWFAYLCESDNTNNRIRGIIYLCVQPEECQRRIMRRNRDSEASISFEYLKSLHEKHEEWIKGGDAECDVLVINDSTDENLEKVVSFMKDRIEN